MTTFLLVIIYVIYIGLGLPDSTFGSAWPAINSELNLPIDYGNFVTLIASLCTVLASFVSAKLLNKFGTGLVTAFSTFITALGLVGSAISPSIWWLCASAIPSGLGAGAIDAALNNYVAVHYKSVHLNILHSFYGIGVMLSPGIFSLTLNGLNGWRKGYLVIFCVQITLAIIAFISLPLWNKVKKQTPKEELFTPITLSYKKMAKNGSVRMAWLAFFTSCGLEFTCGIWSSTYFVESVGLTPSTAASFLTLYYLGITSGRFIFGIVSSKISNWNVLYIGYSIVFVAIGVMFLPILPILKGVALFMIGFGNGPMFPNMTFLIPKNFDKEYSQSIISSVMVMCNLGILALPPIYGIMARNITPSIFPFYIAFLYVIMVVTTILYNKRINKNFTKFN